MTDADATPGDAVADSSSGLTWRRALSVVAKVLAGFGLVFLIYRTVLPLIIGAPWAGVVDVVAGLTKRQVLLLGVIWFSGLYAHSFVLTAAMPRLTHRRALTLSLTGSAVSNLVPMGGALGIGLNYWMSRSWGFTQPAFTLYTFVTNLWDVMTKLSLPALAIAALLLTGDVTHPQLATIAELAMIALGALLLLVLTALASERAASLLGRIATPPLQLLFRLCRSARRVELATTIVQLRRESIHLLRTGWVQLSLGMVAYSALQALLLWSSLHMLGTTLTAPEIFAGYALERVLTLAMITPGGTGFVEVGITALLIAFGGDPVTTVAGVLIYRAFTFGLEIPVGGAGVAVWVWRRRGHLQSARAQAAGVAG
ncbi:MAG: lysylphosphatidylglycerol synthase domain-containing protein [Nocardioidaceae bacterium]